MTPVLLPGLLLLILPALLGAQALLAGENSPSAGNAQLQRMQSAAREHLSEYLRLDTTNPPGNEVLATAFFGAIFDHHGIDYQVFEPEPGRASIVARIDGGGEPGLLLLHHTDVVPADANYWQVAPFSGTTQDGYIWGRGALDTKGLGILQLEVFLELYEKAKADPGALNRDVVWMATADEEAGGQLGVGWLVEHQPEVFDGLGLVLNEGGGGMLIGDRPVFSIEVTQKVPLWLRLTARGSPGHGSSPRSDSAPRRLVRALARLERHSFEARVVPEVARYFNGLAAIEDQHEAAFFDLENAVRDRAFLRRLQADNPQLHALLQNTCALTSLEGSPKINVVPTEAIAELDCRLLPDENPALFVRELRRVLGEPAIEVEVLMSFSPTVSTTDSELFRVIEHEARKRFPDALVLPSVVAGFTDSHFLRDLGMVAYGFRPSLLPVSEASSVHGNDERIALSDLDMGVEMLWSIVTRLAVTPPRGGLSTGQGLP